MVSSLPAIKGTPGCSGVGVIGWATYEGGTKAVTYGIINSETGYIEDRVVKSGG